MRVRGRTLVLTAIALSASGAVLLASARGSGEPENPFWNLSSKRLEAGVTTKLTVTLVSKVESIIHGAIKSKGVEVRCGSSTLGSASIEGSSATHAGKASGVLELSKCKLWAEETKGVFKEQTECEVPLIKSVPLKAGLWLEGSKKGAGTTADIVFEPKEEGKSKLANIVISTKEACKAYEGSHALEGKFAARLLPQNEEFTYIRWVLPSTPIATVWRPPAEEAEEGVELKLEGTPSTLVSELQAEPGGGAKFGGGTGPLPGIEAPFWGVNGERLEDGVEKGVEPSPLTKEPATLRGHLSSQEIEIRCKSLTFKEGRLIGSLNQMDGRFAVKSIEFAECRLWIDEGGSSKEQTTCEIPTFNTTPLTGKLWLEGNKAERKSNVLLVFDPESGTTFVEVPIKNKGAEKCILGGQTYVATGSIAVKLKPENTEAEIVQFSSPGFTSVNVWQSAEQEAEKLVELQDLCGPAILKFAEFPVKLKGGGKFGFSP